MKGFAGPVVTPAALRVSLLPTDHPEYRARLVEVVHVAPEAPLERQWAVTAMVDQCLARAGTWCDDLPDEEAAKEWLGDHRFTIGEALYLARMACESVVVEGVSTTTVCEASGVAEGRGRDRSLPLREVRTVLGRAERAWVSMSPLYRRDLDDLDPDLSEMRDALDVAAVLLERWRRTDRRGS